MIMHCVFACLLCGGGATNKPVLAVGQPAPPFKAAATNGKTVSLGDYTGTWLVLYFYPKSFTPGCTKEACSLRDGYSTLQSLGAAILGVSFDRMENQVEFKAKHHLPYELLSDTDKSVAKAYDAVGMLGFVAQRKTFIIAPDSTLAHVISSVDTGTHDAQVAAELKRLIKERGQPGTPARPPAQQ